jgi:hypothetical protein
MQDNGPTALLANLLGYLISSNKRIFFKPLQIMMLVSRQWFSWLEALLSFVALLDFLECSNLGSQLCHLRVFIEERCIDAVQHTTYNTRVIGCQQRTLQSAYKGFQVCSLLRTCPWFVYDSQFTHPERQAEILTKRTKSMNVGSCPHKNGVVLRATRFSKASIFFDSAPSGAMSAFLAATLSSRSFIMKVGPNMVIICNVVKFRSVVPDEYVWL